MIQRITRQVNHCSQDEAAEKNEVTTERSASWNEVETSRTVACSSEVEENKDSGTWMEHVLAIMRVA